MRITPSAARRNIVVDIETVTFNPDDPSNAKVKVKCLLNKAFRVEAIWGIGIGNGCLWRAYELPSDRSNTIDWILTRRPIAPVTPKIDHSVSASDRFPLSLVLELQAASQHGMPTFGPLSAYGH